MKHQLLVFVKAPQLAQAKRRLAAGIGDVAAWRFYRETVRGTLARLARDERWQTSIYVTPDRFAVAGWLWPRGLARRPQGGGDLGARMSRALRERPPGPVVLVGSDIPSLTAAHVERAFRALGQADVVFGPAIDGGYWLIGLARRRTRSIALDGVRWSTEWALSDTRAAIGSHHSVTLIDALWDVDDAAGYERLRRAERGTATLSLRRPSLSHAPEGAA